MTIRLQQTSDGTWLKLGAGKPVEATADEIALWQSAQEEPAQGVVEPPSIWNVASNVIKEATVLILVVTFMALFADWNRISTLYAELGAPALALSRFANDPIHGFSSRYVGLLVLVCCAVIGLGWLIYGELNRLIRKSERLQRLAGLLPPILISVALVLLLAVFMTGVSTTVALLGFLVLAGALVIAWLAAGDWIEDPGRKRFAQVFVLLVGIGAFFTIALWVIPERWGRLEARRIFEGGDSLQGAVLVTKETTNMSDQVSVLQGIDDTWIYQSQHMAVPETGERTHTLQYIGDDEDAIYLLDIGVEAVHMIPKSKIVELILLPSTPRMRGFPDASIYVETMETANITTTVPITVPLGP